VSILREMSSALTECVNAPLKRIKETVELTVNDSSWAAGGCTLISEIPQIPKQQTNYVPLNASLNQFGWTSKYNTLKYRLLPFLQFSLLCQLSHFQMPAVKNNVIYLQSPQSAHNR
jgi:hypothetical protein